MVLWKGISMTFLYSLIEKDKELLKALFAVFDEAVRKKGKRLNSLQFARPTEKGWSFFIGKTIQWESLEDVMHQTVKRHPHCHRARVAEAISHMINLSDQELHALRMLL